MRKILLLSSLLCLSGIANAAHGNIYVGPFVGAGITEGKFSSYKTIAGDPTARSNNIGAKNFLGGLVLGYAYPCNRWFAGFELTGNFDTTKKTVINETIAGVAAINERFELKKRASYGFVARFGYRTQSDVVAYIRLGNEWSKTKLTYNGNTVGASAHFSKDTTKFAFVPGLGIEAPIGGKWRVRLEGKYSLRQKASFTIPAIPGGVFTYESSNVKLNAGQTSVLMGATYSF